MNSRGLSSPRFYDYTIMASERRGFKALRHAELVSASHCEPLLTPLLGEILKQVQDDVIVSDER